MAAAQIHLTPGLSLLEAYQVARRADMHLISDGYDVKVSPIIPPGWRRVYLLSLLACLLLIVLVVALQRHVDRAHAARADFLRIVDEKCIPLQDGQSAIAVRQQNIVRCHVYTRNTPGLVRALVSSAVMEVPR